jgi:uncharacterized protein
VTALLLTLATILTGAMLLIVAMVGGVWWRQERIAYQPPAESPAPPPDVQRVEYVAEDGQPLYGYVIDPVGTPTGVLVAFHGNADLATWQIPWGQEIARRTGWCVLLAEYRGYGGLPGAPTYTGVQRDARAAWQTAMQIARRNPSANPRFALFGHSLGSAVATELAAEIHSGTQREALVALVLQSPLTSAREMARIVSTRPVQVLWNLIARVHYDSRARLDVIDTPVWISHGERDWLVPVAMGRELFARTRVPGELLVVRDASHNDVDHAGGDAYWRWIGRALTAPERVPSRHESESTLRTGMSG